MSATTKGLSSPRSQTLDQWRGWAMVLVLINHGLKHTGWVEGLGRSGVNLFFVISGMLTAYSLISANRKNQNYFVLLPAKRLWRLYPVLLIYLVITIFWAKALGLSPNPNITPIYPLVINYTEMGFGVWHLWSVACEMHFYILSPFLFYLSVRFKVLGPILLAVLMAVLIGFMMLYVFSDKLDLGGGAPFFDSKYATHTSVWPMLLGFCLALYPIEKFQEIARRLKPLQAVLVSLAIASPFIALFMGSANFTVLVGLFAIPVFFVTTVNQFCITGRCGKMLEWIGVRTFSIYLLQQLLTLDLPFDPIWRPVGALVAIICGGMFYKFIECYFLKLPSFEKNRG